MNTNHAPEEFRVIGWIRDEARKIKYRVVRSNGSRTEEEFIAAALPTYTLPNPPKTIYGRVMLDDKGKRYVQQDDFYTYQLLYNPDKTYRFEVVGAIIDSRNGNRRYLVSSGDGYRHLYISDSLEDVEEGDRFDCRVAIVKGKDERAFLLFVRSSDDLGKFEPSEVFQRIGHKEEYNRLFEELEDTYALTERMRELFREVRAKLSKKNRLWMFDYLSILELLLFTVQHEDCSEARLLAILIRDMESWIINESGLLGSFNADRREDTRKRAQSTINDCEAMVMAIDLMGKGEQDAYFESRMDGLRKNRPLESTVITGRILRMLALLDEEFLIRNYRSWAWMIELSNKWEWDALILQRIVKAAVGWVNESLRSILKPVHFDSGRITPDEETERVILLAGALVNFSEARGLKKGNDYSVDSQFLIVSLCKIVSFLVPKKESIEILNKAKELVMAERIDARFSMEALEAAAKKPHLLASELLQLNTYIPSGLLYDMRGTLLMTYDKGVLGIGKIGKKMGKMNILERVRLVTAFPNLNLSFLDVQGGDMTGLKTIGDCRDYWKALFEKRNWSNEEPSEEISGDSQLVYVKQAPSRYDGLIFCRMERAADNREGVIGYRDYARNFRWTLLTELFDPGMLFKADVIKEGRNRYHFDITGELRDFSRERALLGEEQIAICIGLSPEINRGFFITENLAMVSCKTLDAGCEIGKSYRIQIIQSVLGEYPGGIVISETIDKLDAKTLLKGQLKAISDQNIASVGDVAPRPEVTAYTFPYVHLLLDLHLRFVEKEVDRYNLLQLLRLVSIKEKSGLAILYTARILVMEARYANEHKVPFVSSLPSFDWSPETIRVSEDMRELHQEFITLTENNAKENQGNENQPDKESTAIPKGGREAKLRLIEGLIQELAGTQDIEKVMSGIKELSLANLTEVQVIPGLTFYEDGSYALNAEEEGVMKVDNLRGYIVEVFSDGTVGKVPGKVVDALEEGIVYSLSEKRNGCLKGLFSMDEADALVLWYVTDGEHRIKVLPVEDVDAEERIGYPGSYRLPGKDVMIYSTLPLMGSWVEFELLAKEEGYPLKGTNYQNLIKKLNYRLKQYADSIEEEDFLGDIKNGLFDKVRQFVNSLYLDRNRFVSIASAMPKALSLIEEPDLFWSLFALCNHHKGFAYILKMVEALKGRTIPAPPAKVIEEIMEDLLANPKWINGAIGMADLTWEWLSPTIQQRVLRCDTECITASSYISYIRISGMSCKEAVEFLRIKDCPAAKFALYETLKRGYGAGEISQEAVIEVREGFPKGNLSAYFQRDLVTVGVLGEQPQYVNDTGIRRIIRGGAAVFYSACKLRTAHEVAVFCQGDKTDWIGKKVSAKIETKYQNHYLVRGEMKVMLVPKCWCLRAYEVGDTIEVEVERFTKKNQAVIAYEVGMPTPLPEDPGILQPGDRVTVRFARFSRGYAVRLQDVYNRATFRVINMEEIKVDYTRAYVGLVETAENDDLTYEIRLLEAI